MRRILLTALLVLTATFTTGNATSSFDDSQVRATISVWHDLNALCRGGSGDSSEIMVACCTRTKVSALLNQMVYCYRMGER